jgi:hypothetical protein
MSEIAGTDELVGVEVIERDDDVGELEGEVGGGCVSCMGQ